MIISLYAFFRQGRFPQNKYSSFQKAYTLPFAHGITAVLSKQVTKTSTNVTLKTHQTAVNGSWQKTQKVSKYFFWLLTKITFQFQLFRCQLYLNRFYECKISCLEASSTEEKKVLTIFFIRQMSQFSLPNFLLPSLQ